VLGVGVETRRDPAEREREVSELGGDSSGVTDRACLPRGQVNGHQTAEKLVLVEG